MESKRKAERFYTDLIDLFLIKHAPFMIGGTYAFTVYTGIQRATKDVDFFCTPGNYPTLLKICSDEGYKTELLDKNWIAKVHKDTLTADIIFGERNGLYEVQKDWFERAKPAEILGRSVKLMPIEDMIRSKSYIQARNRFDGADVVHLILKHGKTLDWQYLYKTMEQDWELLLSYVLLFSFVYPSDRDSIPQWLFQTLIDKLQKEYTKSPSTSHVTRGLLLSSQYNVAIEKWGYRQADLLPAS